MNMRRIYMDNAATTPVHPEVLEAMLPYFKEGFGNPSSIYQEGREARKAIEAAREKVAQALGAESSEIFFTSGGTEADNLAVLGVARANAKKGNHIVTSAIEHHAVLEPCHWLEKEGFRITRLPVDSGGLVDPDDVRKALTGSTILVSIMHANNEVGSIEPIEEISQVCREAGVLLHSDAVQSMGQLDVNVDKLGVDLLTATGHKIYGPKGTGCLYMRKRTKLQGLMLGGGQEKRVRSGTENVAGIIGFGKAMELAGAGWKERSEHMLPLRDRLIEGLLEGIPYTELNGDRHRRLPNNANVRFKFIEGEAICLRLDYLGIAASTGSACSSDSLEASHVLLALGIPIEEAHGSLRLTLGRENTAEDVDYVLEKLPGVIESLRAMSPLYPGH
ncbi:MAG: cysteine desulfurase NifS [Candidatus Solincola sediminis]|uniref:Cysteine desulfurase IscS n=1 Tax=Candidatus Solincola sediminis TaxID=1797199 RepID=A0A1F2WJB3_9ACTN|nr:MAG: cysteine desulfurase NifS [Candidatus Solincola sediminis]OFW56955.1 MAG: cysteine desulfurase NifS [Candidatus Solincola sediminis]